MTSIVFPSKFPDYHPLKGNHTCFAAGILQGLKAKTTTRLTEDTWAMAMDISRTAKYDKNHQIMLPPTNYSPGAHFIPMVQLGPDDVVEFHDDIEIVSTWDIKKRGQNIVLNGLSLTEDELETFAHNEGFETVQDMFDFYPHDLDGTVICWNKDITY